MTRFGFQIACAGPNRSLCFRNCEQCARAPIAERSRPSHRNVATGSEAFNCVGALDFELDTFPLDEFAISCKPCRDRNS